MAPLCKLDIRFDHTKGMFCASFLGIGLKIGGNLSEDLSFIYFFFFCSSPNFGQKIGLNLSEDLSFFFFAFWAKNWTPNFGRKIGLNLSEDLFFLLLTSFWRKIGLNLSRTISDSDLCSSQIFCPPPPFSNSCICYCVRYT